MQMTPLIIINFLFIILVFIYVVHFISKIYKHLNGLADVIEKIVDIIYKR